MLGSFLTVFIIIIKNKKIKVKLHKWLDLHKWLHEEKKVLYLNRISVIVFYLVIQYSYS